MGKITAKWNGAVIAECDEKDIVIMEGNSYFPPTAVNKSMLADMDNPEKYVCKWKGECQFYDVVVNGTRNAAAAWVYPDPKPAANTIKGYLAFWKGVEVGNA